MTNLQRRLQQIQLLAEQSAEDCQIAHVQALCELTRQVARLVSSHQFVNGIDDDPDDQEESTVIKRRTQPGIDQVLED